MHTRLFCACLSLLFAYAALAPDLNAAEVEASAPQSMTVSIYDLGFGLVNELRRVSLERGENNVRLMQLPAALDSSTVLFSPRAGKRDFEVLEQEFFFDLGSSRTIFDRYINKRIRIETRDGTHEGVLLNAPSSSGQDESIVLALNDGSSLLFPSVEQLDRIVFPDVNKHAYVEPTLLWRVNAGGEQLQNVRLSYVVDKVSWAASYDMILHGNGREAHLDARVSIVNHTGGTFTNARIRLVTTERGSLDLVQGSVSTPFGDRRPASQALRYAYGSQEPAVERSAASAGAMNTYALPSAVTIPSGVTKNFQMWVAPKVPVSRFYVYDGVRFDRFQRNRRNDWNYGTEYHQAVETHVEFENSENIGLGLDMPPGLFRLYENREDTVDLVGEDTLRPTPAGTKGNILLGPARGLKGERERTGYREIKPLHEYEESFEIRLSNDSEEDVTIRVVEHLYRWHEFEIVRADTEYVLAGDQSIVFEPTVKAGGKRSVHYTVRYAW